MPHLLHRPLARDDIPLPAATPAARPVAPACRRSVRLLAPAIVLACLASPFVAGLSHVAAFIILLAVLLRCAALVVHAPPAAAPTPRALPAVTVLLPLRQEAAVVAQLVGAVQALDYPADRIEVIVLLEADDPGTLREVRLRAPRHWRVAIVPDVGPRTKPRACNHGLALASGDIIVIFDGEDRPEPDQARKAAAALAADPTLGVAQARLGCDHLYSTRDLLPMFWALEYAALFGAIQPALVRLRLPFSLGGTSNWCRTAAVRAVGGWDAHNVTEDADLAVRLARAGWSSTVIDSTTWEEAPIRLDQWLKQRSRWLKGFAVTTAAHASQPLRAAGELGWAGTLAFLAQLPATLVCAAVHPIGLALLATGRLEGALAVLALAGYAVSCALHAVAARRQGMPPWLGLAVPVYWLLHSAALFLALIDLVRAPAHWRKTEHGLARRPGAPASRGQIIGFRPWTADDAPRPANRSARPIAARVE